MSIEKTNMTLEISPKLLSIYNVGPTKVILIASEKLSGLSIYNAIDSVKSKKIRWNDVTVILNNENSSIMPYEFSNDENTVNKICSILFNPKEDIIVVKEQIRTDLVGESLLVAEASSIINSNSYIGNVSFLYTIEKKLYSHVNDCFFPQKVIIKHKGNIFLNLVSEFIDRYPIHIGYKVFIYLEKNNFYISVFESINCNKIDNEKKAKYSLIFYNRFGFESYGKAVYYVLLVLSTIKIDIYKKISIATLLLPLNLSTIESKGGDYLDRLKLNIPKDSSAYKTVISIFGDHKMNLTPFYKGLKKYVNV